MTEKQQVNEQLVDEYINSLSSKVNELQKENLILKARASYNEKQWQEREMNLKLELQQALDKVETPKVKEDEPVQNPVPTFTNGAVNEEPKKKVKPSIKAPKPKGYNAKVDGPRKVIPNPKYVAAEANIQEG
tara:strand:- start:371 stop:766 length:396 start_codon:yes stop_codon:yes gene_type:complete